MDVSVGLPFARGSKTTMGLSDNCQALSHCTYSIAYGQNWPFPGGQ